MDGYLVWNSRCQMLSKEPLDPSIRSHVKKEKFERCWTDAQSRVSRENGTFLLSVDASKADLGCCWSSVTRPERKQPEKASKDNSSSNVDSSIV